jgi:hypothetical protein
MRRWLACRFLAFGFSVIFAAVMALPAAAQRGGHFGALGGSASMGAMSHPLGGGISRPPALGGGIGSRPIGGRDGFRNNNNVYYRSRGNYPYAYPYAYSYYVPGYFDYLDSNAYFDPSYAVPPAPGPEYYGPSAPSQTQQPVTINQYFGAQGPQNNAPQALNPPPNPGDPLVAPSDYYLIAYKNHSVYPALAYWVEDKTLHYVTTQNTHNQASLDLIDLNLTKSLNQTRDVPFSIPGQ